MMELDKVGGDLLNDEPSDTILNSSEIKEKWAMNHQDEIINLISSGEIQKLLNLCCDTKNGSSIRQWAAKLKCSRRSLRRYLYGERKIPITVLKTLLKVLEFKEEDLIPAIEIHHSPETIDGKIVWYGKGNDLVNTLYIYRTIISPMSFFQMSYRLEIDPQTLANYECGKKRISPYDVHKICHSFGIVLTDLFPQLVSWDAGESFLPLAVEGKFKIEGCKNSWIDCYVNSDGDDVDLVQNWPINRYDKNGHILMNVMPNELTMDEYYNTSDILFYDMDNDCFLPGPDFNPERLPPNYWRYQRIFLEKGKNVVVRRDRTLFHSKVLSLIFHPTNSTICFMTSKTRGFTLDISPYIHSKSPLYQLLADPEYFVQGVLTEDKMQEQTVQFVLWPDGQYIRVDELTLDRDPFKVLPLLNGVCGCGLITNWICWARVK